MTPHRLAKLSARMAQEVGLVARAEQWTTKKRVEKLRYMPRNPVKRGLVESPEQWRWSSYRFYRLGETGPVRVNVGWTEIFVSRSCSLNVSGKTLMMSAVRYPPLQKTQGRGTHSFKTEKKKQL